MLSLKRLTRFPSVLVRNISIPKENLWVKFNGNRAAKVPTTKCVDVDDFIDQVKKKLPQHFKHLASDEITLHSSTEQEALQPDADLETLFSLENTARKPLILKTFSSNDLTDRVNDLNLSTIHPSKERRKRFAQLNEIIIRAEIEMRDKAIEKDEKKRGKKLKGRLSFSDLNWTLVGPIYDPITVPYTQGTKPIPPVTLEQLKQYKAAAITSFGGIDSVSEATLNLYIGPLLAYVCSLFNGDVRIVVEETMNGKRVKTHGRFEFVLKKGNKRIFIVEAKKDDFQQGATQALLGCEVAAEWDETDVVYGIVTNFRDWVFYKSCNDKIEKDDSCKSDPDEPRPLNDVLTDVTGKIYAILSDL